MYARNVAKSRKKRVGPQGLSGCGQPHKVMYGRDKQDKPTLFAAVLVGTVNNSGAIQRQHMQEDWRSQV